MTTFCKCFPVLKASVEREYHQPDYRKDSKIYYLSHSFYNEVEIIQKNLLSNFGHRQIGV